MYTIYNLQSTILLFFSNKKAFSPETAITLSNVEIAVLTLGDTEAKTMMRIFPFIKCTLDNRFWLDEEAYQMYLKRNSMMTKVAFVLVAVLLVTIIVVSISAL